MDPTSEFTFHIPSLAARLGVTQFEGFEGLSELFRFDVTLVGEGPSEVEAVVGRQAVLAIAGERGVRYVHGIVSRFEQLEDGGGYTVYRAALVPTLWRLQHRYDCRIFQGLRVPEIIARVLRAAGLESEEFRFQLELDHRPLDYCVQYRESDWAFVSRLMEEQGLYAFFEHEGARHVFVVVDAKSAHAAIPPPVHLPFRPDSKALVHREGVSVFRYAEELAPGMATLRDYDFARPNLDLEASARSGDGALEVYDYPGDHAAPADGARLAKLRLEAARVASTTAEGDSGCPQLSPGHVFSLEDHPTGKRNGAYLVVRVSHRGSRARLDEGARRVTYENRFRAIPADAQYRAPIETPRPTIKGVQTAIVVGPDGEEIHTDEHGRVKVQFFWDRRGRRDEHTSCWLRVSQAWAGAGWGAMNIPRVGHEVVVEFFDGDPDRPLVVGRVYHGTNAPPYSLPENATKSTLKSSSSPGGDGFNELRYEDKAGSEEIHLRAQKDFDILVLNDKSQSIGRDEALNVGHDRDKTVGHDQSETIRENKTISVGGTHTEVIHKAKALTVKGSRTKSIGGNQAESIGGGKTTSVGGSFAEDIGGGASISITADKVEGIGGSSAESVGGDKKTIVNGKRVLSVVRDNLTTVKGDDKEQVSGVAAVHAIKGVMLTSQGSAVLIQGDGEIHVSGANVVVTAKTDLTLHAIGKVRVVGAASVDVASCGTVKVKGGNVEIN